MRRITLAVTLAAAPAMAALLTLGMAGGASAAPAAAGSGVTNIPVLSYHQLDNGCAKTDALCDPAGSPAARALSRMSKSQLAGADGLSGAAPAPGTDINSLSQTQFGAELAWLKAQGYHSVTAAQYLSWDTGKAVTLPSKPILITVDDGIEDFYADGTSVLQKYGFTAVAFVVTQFADGATAGAQPYVGWDATWKQLAALPRATWSFAFHAGAQGHSVTYPDNPGCTYVYPCQLPTETAAQYEARVSGEVAAGRLELNQYLPVNDNFWAVPWNAIGQPSQPVSGADPPVWLAPWAANVFKVVFIQDPDRSDVSHERYRLEVHGDMSLADFESNLIGNTANGFFNK